MGTLKGTLTEEEINSLDKVSEEELKQINSHNFFVALVESKKLSSPEMIEYLNVQLDYDTLEKRLYKQINALPYNQKVLILKELEEKGIKQYIVERQSIFLEEVARKKSERIEGVCPQLAFLAKVKDKWYDFALGKYFDDENYYINYAIPFVSIINQEDWWFEYFEEGIALLGFTDEAIENLENFYQLNYSVIDKTTETKIIKYKK